MDFWLFGCNRGEYHEMRQKEFSTSNVGPSNIRKFICSEFIMNSTSFSYPFEKKLPLSICLLEFNRTEMVLFCECAKLDYFDKLL